MLFVNRTLKTNLILRKVCVLTSGGVTHECCNSNVLASCKVKFLGRISEGATCSGFVEPRLRTGKTKTVQQSYLRRGVRSTTSDLCRGVEYAFRLSFHLNTPLIQNLLFFSLFQNLEGMVNLSVYNHTK